jgi:AAA family ATP:ADP antiporter
MDPTLAALAILTIARRGLGFGVMKPSTDMLYSAVTPEEKYKTKNFIDTAIYRSGDLIGTWSVRGLMSGLGMGLSAVLWVMVPFAAIWSAVAIWLGRDYKRRAKLGIGEQES